MSPCLVERVPGRGATTAGFGGLLHPTRNEAITEHTYVNTHSRKRLRRNEDVCYNELVVVELGPAGRETCRSTHTVPTRHDSARPTR